MAFPGAAPTAAPCSCRDAISQRTGGLKLMCSQPIYGVTGAPPVCVPGAVACGWFSTYPLAHEIGGATCAVALG